MQPDQNQEETNNKPSPANQPTSTPQPSTTQFNGSTGSGMEIIQPLSSNPSPTPSAEPQPQNVVTQTVAPSSVQTTVAGSSAPVSTPAPNAITSTMHVDGQLVAYSATSQLQTEKHHIPWFRVIGWALFVLILLGAGTVLSTNQNIRATVFRQRFVSYTYPKSKHSNPPKNFSVLFYRGSNEASSWTPTPAPGQSPPTTLTDVLISPVKEGKQPMILSIKAGPVSANNDKINANLESECSSKLAGQGFSVYIPALSANANFCSLQITLNGSSTIFLYAAGIGSPSTKTDMSVIVEEDFAIAPDGQGGIKAITPLFNLQDYQSDIQKIVASIKPQFK